jgi:polar amino acid transport system substrate-binding protein
MTRIKAVRRLSLSLSAVLAMICSSPLHAADFHFLTQPFPPFTYEKSGKAAGPLVEVMEALCAAAHRVCTVEMAPWRRATFDVGVGLADGMFPVLATPERRQTLRLLEPIVRSSYAFVVPDQSTWTYAGPASLEGHTVGVYGPSGTSAAAEQVVGQTTNCRVEIDLTNEEVLRKVAAGQYGPNGIGFANRDVALSLIGTDGMNGLKLAGGTIDIDYVIALSRTRISEADAKTLDAALKTLKADGTLREILSRHHLRYPE